MPELMPTLGDYTELLTSNIELKHQVQILTAVALASKWISREETEYLLNCAPATLKDNAGKWGLKYRKGKRKIEYWLPTVIQRLEAKKTLASAIEKKVMDLFNREEPQKLYA